MNRLDRLFGIMTMLQSRSFTTAEKIAEKFGISVRTVYRDVKTLNEQGSAIEFEAGKGYYVVPGYFLPPVTFTSEEANALLLVESLVDGFADNSIRKNYSAALSKIKSVLKEKERNRIEKLSEQIMLHVPDCFRMDFDFISTIQDAIDKKKILEIAYVNKGEIASKRKIEPIGLVFYAMAWHVIGWCHKRSSYRDFKVARIKTAKIIDEDFLFSDHMTLDKYVTEAKAEAREKVLE